jgi:hypothetical protein
MSLSVATGTYDSLSLENAICEQERSAGMNRTNDIFFK